MILLQASHIAKHYEANDVLVDANLTVQTGERVALVGPNGAGKSTLLRIAVRAEEPSAGEVSMAKGTNIGYVSQFVEADEGMTVFQYVAETFRHLYDMEQRLRDMEQEMAKPEVYSDEGRFQQLSAAYDALQRQFAEANGYAVEARVRRVLDGLNFPTAMHDRPVRSLSGGQKTRLSLARLLAWEPDLLVLDEPTNYLDTETLSWLENYLQGYPGALLVVSHDRYFLDKVATVIYELENGKTTRYVGNYSDYVEQKAARLEADLKRYEAQQKEIARQEMFIQKNIARATTTRRAQSRRKMLERMERIEKPNTRTPTLALRFTCAKESGKDVLTVENLVIGYPGKRLPGPLNLSVAKGQRIAILGPNGIGKSTFLKAIVGRLKPQSGLVRWGTNAVVGYYDQEQADLHDHKTVLAEVWDEFPRLDMTTVRTALGRFLFRGDDVEKPVAALSGGERSRLALCKLMLKQANVLVMDEPTNHLDLVSKEVLEDALQDYEGTLLFVSHDRYFVDALATHVVTLDEAGFRVYIGNYSDYVAKVEADKKWQDDTSSSSSGSAGDAPASVRDQRASAEGAAPQAQSEPRAERRHVRSAVVRKLKEKVAAMEQQIADMEERQQAIGNELTEAAASQDVDRTLALQAELDQLMEAYAKLLEEWERQASELEELEQHMQ
jgi:ATP-binding cassette subfamily F protein 3